MTEVKIIKQISRPNIPYERVTEPTIITKLEILDDKISNLENILVVIIKNQDIEPKDFKNKSEVMTRINVLIDKIDSLTNSIDID